MGLMKKSLLLLALLGLCAVALLTACGTALSEVFLQMHGPALFLGL